MTHEITARAPRNKRSQRKGRGESSGRGKTSGRGGKGASARGGGPYWKPGHEGGQTPIFRRVPKRGFSNHDFERRFHVVNVSELARFDEGTTVDAATLIGAGLVPDDRQPVKILGNGDFSGKKLTVVAGWFSKSAHEKITAAGGTAQNLKGEPFEFPKPKKRFVKREGVKKTKGADAPAEAAAAASAAATPAPAAAPDVDAPPAPTEG